jgi:integrase
VDAYKRQRHDEEGAAPGTVDRELAFARWLFNRAVREGKARRNPVEPSSFFHEDNKKERVLTGDEERRLLAASPPWLQDFVRFALLTGLRKTQIQTLKWSQVEKHRGRIFLPAAVCKDKRDHLLPLNESAQAIIAAQTRRGEYVFGGEKPLENVYHAFKGALEQAGLDKEIRIHDLRHSFASRVADLGADISSLQAAMQHADLKTTQRYIHPSAQAMERAVRLLDFSHQSVTIPFSEVAQEAVAVAVSGGAPIASEVGGMMNEPVLKCMGHAGKQ